MKQRQRTDLINEIKGDCPLSNLHLLAFPVFAVVLANLTDPLVQLAGSLIFHPVLLAFQL